MTESEIRIAHEPLQQFTREVFSQAGMPPQDAETEAVTLIWANLRGVDSHGVLRIPWYVDNIDKGVMNPKPNIRVVHETPATLLIDADRALGPVVTTPAMELAMKKAGRSAHQRCYPGIRWKGLLSIESRVTSLLKRTLRHWSG